MRDSMGQKMFSSNRISNSAIVAFLLASLLSPTWACSYTWLENVEQQSETLAGRIPIPFQFRCDDDNTSDSTTHIETWESLVKAIGTPDSPSTYLHPSLPSRNSRDIPLEMCGM